MDQSKNGLPVFVILILLTGTLLGVFVFGLFSKKSTQEPIPIQAETNQIVMSETTASKPTSRPTGPGQYACSIGGDCKDWDPNIRALNCTVSFSDRLCLDQCGDITKRCKI